MRVACLSQDPGIRAGSRKGAATHVRAMRSAFSELGAEVLEIDALGDEEAFDRLERLHAAAPLDLVYERYALAAAAGARFCRQSGAPLVLEVNAPLLEEARVHRGRPVDVRDERREREVFRSALRILAVSTAVASYVARRGVPAERIAVRPNGIDTRYFRPFARRAELRRSLGLEEAFVLGFHGRLRPWHGFQHLVETVARLRARGVPAHVLAVGEGDFHVPIAGALPAQALEVLPWMAQDELAQHVACFDVLALTYPADAPCYFSPLKLAEAMACAVVPVVPDLGDLGRIVQHGCNGIVYRAGDWEGLTDALAHVAGNGALRARLGSQAARSAEGNTWMALAAEILSLVSPERTA